MIAFPILLASAQMPLRIPHSLHRGLKDAAKAEGVSLNQYCLYLLARNVTHPPTAATRKGENLLAFLEEARLLQAELDKNRPAQVVTEKPEATPLTRLKTLYGKNRRPAD